MAAHDTDNIPRIPGLEVHPIQAAEQARIAAAAAQNATAEAPAVPQPVESVKDMSLATRRILENISSLLKDARPLTPTETTAPDRAEAPVAPAAGAAPKPSLASATNAEGAPNTAPTSSTGAVEAQSSLSPGADGGAPAPQ
jgi:hypothetical protein